MTGESENLDTGGDGKAKGSPYPDDTGGVSSIDDEQRAILDTQVGDMKNPAEVVQRLRERLTTEAREAFDNNQNSFRPWEDKMTDALEEIAKELGEVEFSMRTDLNDVIFQLNGDTVVVTRHFAGARVGAMDTMTVSGYTMSRADYEKPWFQSLLARVPLSISLED